MADTSILEQTQAFITEQREALIRQRETIFEQQQTLQNELDQANEMLRRFDAFEGKAASPARSTPARRSPRGMRRGSKREQLLQVIRDGNGLTRGDILEKMGLKGDKSGEMSVSNALTAMTKANQVVRRDGKYIAALEGHA